MTQEIELCCILYLHYIKMFRYYITLLSYDLDNIDLQIKLLILHEGIKECREEMRERLKRD